MLPIASTDEELDLGEERLKVRDVWHGELHKSVRTEKEVSKNLSENHGYLDPGLMFVNVCVI